MILFKKFQLIISGLIIIIFFVVVSLMPAQQVIHAEQQGGSPESGATSYLKTVYTSMVTLKHGEESSGSWGNWGALWNRIRSSIDWMPSGCSTQQYHDSHASATEGNNCSLTWTNPGDAITGTDARTGRGGKDPRTGLIWSQLLLNNAGTVTFSAASNSDWSWDGTTDADSIAVGNKTASQLCSERGDGWRLPTQKELMQAYIDGSFWNLTQSDNYFWSVTEKSAANAWRVSLSLCYTINSTKTTSSQVRCVR